LRASSLFAFGSNPAHEGEDALARALRLSEEEARKQKYPDSHPQGRMSRQSSFIRNPRSTSEGDGGKVKYKASDVKQLEKMGFTKDQAVQALIESNNDVQLAAEMLATSIYGR
jgi:hypothetical protein